MLYTNQYENILARGCGGILCTIRYEHILRRGLYGNIVYHSVAMELCEEVRLNIVNPCKGVRGNVVYQSVPKHPCMASSLEMEKAN